MKQKITPEEYVTFGVTRWTSSAEVKDKWRVWAAVLHPDHGGDPIKFAAMQELYQKIAAVAKICPRCEGTGRVDHTAGFTTVKSICASCRGSGEA